MLRQSSGQSRTVAESAAGLEPFRASRPLQRHHGDDGAAHPLRCRCYFHLMVSGWPHPRCASSVIKLFLLPLVGCKILQGTKVRAAVETHDREAVSRAEPGDQRVASPPLSNNDEVQRLRSLCTGALASSPPRLKTWARGPSRRASGERITRTRVVPSAPLCLLSRSRFDSFPRDHAGPSPIRP